MPAFLKNKDNLILSNDHDILLQPVVQECEDGHGEEEIHVEEPYNGLEIVEQSALDHFNAVLQKAQRAATEAQKEKPRKRPKRYDGKSKRTLKRHKNFREDLAKKGFLSVFDFMAHMKETAQKKVCLEQLVPRELESEQVSDSEESAPEELDTEALVSEHTDQVRRKDLLMH